jgi:hypothetical protein
VEPWWFASFGQNDTGARAWLLSQIHLALHQVNAIHREFKFIADIPQLVLTLLKGSAGILKPSKGD